MSTAGNWRNTGKVLTVVGTFLVLLWSITGCRKDPIIGGDHFSPNGYTIGEEFSGGSGTSFDLSQNAFNHSAQNLSNSEETQFVVGNSFFRQNWVIAPSSTEGRDGLGPLYNATSCSGCHLRDGRGRPPEFSGEVSGLLVRLSNLGMNPFGGPMPDPVYGGQFQTIAIPGVEREGTMDVSYQSVSGNYADGEPWELSRPFYQLMGNYGPMTGILTSPRVGQQLCGLGLLEAIPENVILAQADPNDLNGDGISGRPNRVYDHRTGTTRLGRFGWKANQPDLYQQTADAFNGDIGLTSSLFQSDHCTSAQLDCAGAINGNNPGENVELSNYQLDRVQFYVSTIAVPARRNVQDPNTLRGKAIFNSIGCATCHTPSFTTGPSSTSPALSNQTIYPYTDMLLHDLGPELADERTDFLATGSEWRTPPLWGIGLFQTTNGHTRYLHDGRARNLAEAILWHGGEAATMREQFVQLTAEERAALLTFLQSL